MRNPEKPGRRKRSRGGAMLEIALMGPWVFLLFIGALDWGFYAYALISTQAAARSAALYTSSSDATTANTAANVAAACNIVLGEMRYLPNIGSAASTCDSNPVVTVEPVSGPDSANASRVKVVYQSVPLIPIPGLLQKQFTAVRIVMMRVRS